MTFLLRLRWLVVFLWFGLVCEVELISLNFGEGSGLIAYGICAPMCVWRPDNFSANQNRIFFAVHILAQGFTESPYFGWTNWKARKRECSCPVRLSLTRIHARSVGFSGGFSWIEMSWDYLPEQQSCTLEIARFLSRSSVDRTIGEWLRFPTQKSVASLINLRRFGSYQQLLQIKIYLELGWLSGFLVCW